jgi:integrase
METKGKGKQTIDGCSPRTIIQVIAKILKPILQFAVDNDVLTKIPKIEVPKIPKDDKKKVTNATDKFIMLYKSIITLYKNDPFYRALFLFAWYGRRWNEIRTLEWNDIDFLNSSYTIRAVNNKSGLEQQYDLPIAISEALQHIKDRGLVFPSPVTGGYLFPPKRQLKKIKEYANIPELTMHYFRHILVSTMGESGVADSILSASLGHSVNSNLVKTTYQTINHKKSSKEANNAIDTIVSKRIL